MDPSLLPGSNDWLVWRTSPIPQPCRLDLFLTWSQLYLRVLHRLMEFPLDNWKNPLSRERLEAPTTNSTQGLSPEWISLTDFHLKSLRRGNSYPSCKRDKNSRATLYRNRLETGIRFAERSHLSIWVHWRSYWPTTMVLRQSTSERGGDKHSQLIPRLLEDQDLCPTLAAFRYGTSHQTYQTPGCLISLPWGNASTCLSLSWQTP